MGRSRPPTQHAEQGQPRPREQNEGGGSDGQRSRGARLAAHYLLRGPAGWQPGSDVCRPARDHHGGAPQRISASGDEPAPRDGPDRPGAMWAAPARARSRAGARSAPVRTTRGRCGARSRPSSSSWYLVAGLQGAARARRRSPPGLGEPGADAAAIRATTREEKVSLASIPSPALGGWVALGREPRLEPAWVGSGSRRGQHPAAAARHNDVRMPARHLHGARRDRADRGGAPEERPGWFPRCPLPAGQARRGYHGDLSRNLVGRSVPFRRP